jgi:hypothetical protein
MKENEVGGACNTHGRDEKWIKKLWSVNLNGRDHLEDLGVDRRIILELTFGK